MPPTLTRKYTKVVAQFSQDTDTSEPPSRHDSLFKIQRWMPGIIKVREKDEKRSQAPLQIRQ